MRTNFLEYLLTPNKRICNGMRSRDILILLIFIGGLLFFPSLTNADSPPYVDEFSRVQASVTQTDTVLSDTTSGPVVINQVKLIDTIVAWLARGAICLGAFALFGVAIFFVILQYKGNRLKQETLRPKQKKRN